MGRFPGRPGGPGRRDHIGNAPVLPERPEQVPTDQKIGRVTADGASDPRKCHDARRAAAVIPPRKIAEPWRPTGPGAVSRNEALRASKDLGRDIWRRRRGSPRRSRVETKMTCIKLLGQPWMASRL